MDSRDNEIASGRTIVGSAADRGATVIVKIASQAEMAAWTAFNDENYAKYPILSEAPRRIRQRVEAVSHYTNTVTVMELEYKNGGAQDVRRKAQVRGNGAWAIKRLWRKVRRAPVYRRAGT